MQKKKSGGSLGEGFFKLMPEGIEGRADTTTKRMGSVKVRDDSLEASATRADKKGAKKQDKAEKAKELERAKQRAKRIYYNENDLIAPIVPEADRRNDPMENKKVPTWLAKKGFEVPFEVESVYDGEHGKVHYCLTGPKEPRKSTGLLICFHGFNGHREIWERTHEMLTKRGEHYVLSLDLYGHGLSENVVHKTHKKTYGLEFFRRQALNLLEHLNLQGRQRTVVGFSMGSLIAADLANHEPEKTDRCIFISPAFYVDQPGAAKMVVGCQPCIKCVTPCSKSCCVDRCMFKDTSLHSRRNRHGFEKATFQRRMALQTIVKSRVFDAFLGCVAQMPMWDAGELLESLGKAEIPTLILWGDRDNVANPKMAPTVLEFLPNSHLIRFPRCQHLVPEERHAETILLILAFMMIKKYDELELFKYVLPISSHGDYIDLKNRFPEQFPDAKTYHQTIGYRPKYECVDPKLKRKRDKRSNAGYGGLLFESKSGGSLDLCEMNVRDSNSDEEGEARLVAGGIVSVVRPSPLAH